MESVKTLEVSDCAFEEITKRHGKTLDSLERDVNTLEGWLKSQPHLPEIMERIMIKNFLISNKFSIERTKQRIDYYYTIKTVIPDIFDISNPKRENMRQITESFFYFPLPKQTNEFNRVFIAKLRESEYKSLDLYSLGALIQNLQEVRLYEDCMCGDVVVIDLKNMTLEHLMSVTPSLMIKLFACYEKVYSIPMKALHMINSPSYLSYLLTLLKGIMKPKMFDRIHVHTSDTFLLETFPKHMIPKDYGGEERSLEEIKGLWNRKFQEYGERFDKWDTMRVDETLRPEPLVNDEILGFHGNFQKLDID